MTTGLSLLWPSRAGLAEFSMAARQSSYSEFAPPVSVESTLTAPPSGRSQTWKIDVVLSDAINMVKGKIQEGLVTAANPLSPIY